MTPTYAQMREVPPPGVSDQAEYGTSYSFRVIMSKSGMLHLLWLKHQDGPFKGRTMCGRLAPKSWTKATASMWERDVLGIKRYACTQCLGPLGPRATIEP